jgi:hypothetical protein
MPETERRCPSCGAYSDEWSQTGDDGGRWGFTCYVRSEQVVRIACKPEVYCCGLHTRPGEQVERYRQELRLWHVKIFEEQMEWANAWETVIRFQVPQAAIEEDWNRRSWQLQAKDRVVRDALAELEAQHVAE